MAINFPDSPSLNDSHVEGGRRWKWNGTVWERIPASGAQGVQGAQGAQGVQGAQGLPAVGSTNKPLLCYCAEIDNQILFVPRTKSYLFPEPNTIWSQNQLGFDPRTKVPEHQIGFISSQNQQARATMDPRMAENGLNINCNELNSAKLILLRLKWW